MEAESGAKIAIRGKGSVKEGKGRTDAAANSNLEEDLHCLVMADSEEKVCRSPPMIDFFRLQRRLRRLRKLSKLQLRFQRVRMSSREINSVCWLLSTVPYEMTKGRLARTVFPFENHRLIIQVAKLDIVNMIVLKCVLSTPMSSVIAVAKLVILPKIAK